MKIVRWSYNNLHVPMIRDDVGRMWCTSGTLCGVLGISSESLLEIKRRNAEELEMLNPTETTVKDFLKRNKTELGIKRVRSNMILWSEDDMITVALISRSSVSREFRKAVVQLIKEQATTGYVTQDEHNKVLMQLGQTTSRLDNIERLMGLKNGAHVKLSVVSDGRH